MSQDGEKRKVAVRAAGLVQDGMAVGIGTGSTSRMFIEELGARVKREGLRIRCVASSNASHELGASLGLEVVTLNELPELDIYIDGADEVGPGLALIKGGGGALLREKIVASAATRFVVIVDSSKVVPQLGKFPLPVEVIKMAKPLVEGKLTKLGYNPVQRKHVGGSDYLTDENNFILDCHCDTIPDPVKTAAEIRAIVGVVEHGLFLHMGSLALVATPEGVRELNP
ncbi:ribose-5-phosphate isomerase RpiA [Acidicapsa dinghuensis]|uniref:Ribose-5-phosphate isomerase A n=1 Tax=Acidicapsa dinghuensis TaxID=2218256 RepID=A0ABW1E9F0_9BACT|nr:ribose-5-phosphate isomerase RpiA [Acidicapsa dinghuensis]